MSEHKPVIEFWDLDRLVPYPNNPKKHPPAEVEKLSKSLAKFRISNPIQVWTDGVIIAGHGRRLASILLRDNGDERFKKVPVIVRSDLTEAEANALRLSDNEVAGKEYDTEVLQAELAALYETGFDMDSLGFDAKTLDFMAADLGEFNVEDDVFVDDIGEAVEEQKTENTQKAKDVDGSLAPVGDALGFKRVTVAQSREIRNFMSRIETKGGLQGPEALIAALSEVADRLD
jgi:hypothetical protein